MKMPVIEKLASDIIALSVHVAKLPISAVMITKPSIKIAMLLTQSLKVAFPIAIVFQVLPIWLVTVRVIKVAS
jgi:hypothetical protein